MPTAEATGDAAPVRYRIDNMDCPTEEALIRDRLSRIPGISTLGFALMNRTLKSVMRCRRPRRWNRLLPPSA